MNLRSGLINDPRRKRTGILTKGLFKNTWQATENNTHLWD